MLNINSSIGAIALVFIFLVVSSVSAQDTTNRNNCTVEPNEYSHLAAIIDKNRMMSYKYARSLDNQINGWTLQNLYYGREESPSLRVTLGGESNFGLVSTLERNIAVRNNTSTINHTCTYQMSDLTGMAGVQYLGSNSYTVGLMALYDNGGFDFDNEITDSVQQIDTDNGIGFGGFVAIDTPQILDTQIESSVLYINFDYKSSLGPTINELRTNEGGISVLRWNNYITKHFLQGANAFQLKIGVNLEYWANEAIKRTLNSGATTPQSFNASEELSVVNFEPAFAANYFRAWASPSGNALELNINGKIAYGLGSSTTLNVDFNKEIVPDSENTAGVNSIAQFESVLFYSAGINLRQTISGISASFGMHYDGMSGTDVSAGDLLFSAGVAASF